MTWTPWNLTDREEEVLKLFCLGYVAKSVGRHLGISPRTAEIHARRARNKLGGRTMPHAVAIYVGRLGKIPKAPARAKEEEMA